MSKEVRFKCPKCRDYKERAYFNLRKKKGICHNCGFVIPDFDTFKALKGGYAELEDDMYYEDDEEEFVDEFETATKFQRQPLSDTAKEYIKSRGFFCVADGIRLLSFRECFTKQHDSLSQIYRLKEFLTIRDMLKRRICFPCYPESTGFFLARSYEKSPGLKVYFLSKEENGGIGKSEVLYLHPLFQFLKGFRIVPVLVEGEFDALSTVYVRVKDKIAYLGVGVMGKHLSKAQLALLKDVIFDNQISGDSEVIIALDGNEKSDNAEKRRMIKVKNRTKERLEQQFDIVSVIELGDKDPNDLFRQDKKWLRRILR